jgi:hypothetical protein
MTKKIKSVVYGIGGFDESKPENNLIEIVYYTKDELAELEAAEAKEKARQAIVDRLGLTADELKILLG